MNRYSRIFHHITVEDVKKSLQKKEESHKSFLNSVREARTFLRDLNSPHYSNWRESHLNEGMTTAGMMYTTFPSTGESNLENIDTGNEGSFTAAGDKAALNGTVVRASGSGEGSDGGFDVGGNYLGFEGSTDSRWAILNPIDSSKFDTLVLRAIRGDDNNGGEDPDVTGEELRLYYLEPNGSSFKSITVNPAGDQALPADADVIIPLSDGTPQSLRDWTINLPSYARGEGFTYMLFQLSHSGSEFDHFGVTSVKYQRRNPISLFISLDSPEATAFIGGGSNLTPEQKKKRLEDMLAASDEYMEKQFPTNQEAVERAKKNLQRNIDISLDPNTFKFLEYGTPEYNQMYNPRMDANSDTEQIKNALESKGLTIDTLDKDFNSQRGLFQQLGVEGTEILLNNPDTQEQAVTAMGIDFNIIKNLTDDTYEKLNKITHFAPGGTPSTGWNGKFYMYDDPQLEASRVVPLETYLVAKERDGFRGVERPDRAEPGMRYVMEKPYSFSKDSEARPLYKGPQNKLLDDASKAAHRRMYTAGASVGDLGYRWDLTHFEKGIGSGRYRLGPGTNFAREQVVESMTAVLNHMYNEADLFAYMYAGGGVYGAIGVDRTQPYDPLYFLLRPIDGISEGQRALDIALNTTARQLDYGRDSFGGSDPERSYQDHLKENDRTVEKFQEAYRKIKTLSTDFATYDKDEWYDTDDRNVIAIKKVHPYSGLPEPGLTPEEPTPEEPQEPKERDPYNYYPEYDDIEDIPVRVTGQDVKMTIDDLGAAGYSAYKAGGGDAKVKEGYSVAEVIKIGQANINAFAPGAPVQKPISNPKTQAPNLVNNMKLTLSDVLPSAARYKTNIAVSILQNKPVVYNASSRDKQLFLKGLKPSLIGSDSYHYYKVNRSPVPYADENIRERPDGSVEVNPNPSTNNTRPVGDATRLLLGADNPLAVMGKAQVQLVVPSNNPRDAYIRYVDHAYLNLNSKDPDEIPKGDFVTPFLSQLVISQADSPPGRGEGRAAFEGRRNHTGGFSGYPPNIKGDQITRFDVPYSQLPDNLKRVVERETRFLQLGSGTLSKTTDVTATDAASTAADTQKKKKKPTVAAEMYEPKAKHNERITKHPKMKSPKEFFKKADVKPVYPDTPPPKMVNGRHPDLVDGQKVAQRFTKLDPHSAEFMAPTGNPALDANVKKATNTAEKQRKQRTLFGKSNVKENTSQTWSKLNKWRGDYKNPK